MLHQLGIVQQRFHAIPVSREDKDLVTVLGFLQIVMNTAAAPAAASTSVLDYAATFLGVPYVYGGSSPSGFDCSGFVYYVYNSLGYPLSRMISGMNQSGVYVPKSELQPGDIIIFANTYTTGLSHVGIYVGNGQFIHAPSSGKVVSYANLNTDYYIAHYYGAVRYTK